MLFLTNNSSTFYYRIAFTMVNLKEKFEVNIVFKKNYVKDLKVNNEVCNK